MIGPGGAMTEHKPHSKETRSKMSAAAKKRSGVKTVGVGVTVTVTITPPNEELQKIILDSISEHLASTAKLAGKFAGMAASIKLGSS